MLSSSSGGHHALALALDANFGGSVKNLNVWAGLKFPQPTDADIVSKSPEISRLLFLGAADRFSATLGSIHPHLRRGVISPSTQAGLQSLIRYLDLGNPHAVPDLSVEQVEGSLAILGGPVANLHARLIMGCGGVSPLLGITLPVTFDCRPQIVSGRWPKAEPWELIIDGRSSDAECLVITSLPMDRGGERLTIFAGLHGAGTQAVDLVLGDRALLDRLYRDTRHLLAWQAVIEVHAIDMQTPKSLGGCKVFEIAGVDFFDPKRILSNQLIVDDRQISELIDMLPSDDFIDASDPFRTSIININEYKLRNSKHRGNIIKARNPKKDQQRDLGVLTRHSDDSVVPEPPLNQEVYMDIAKPSARRARFGRPRKGDNNELFSKRLQIVLSERDVQSIEAIMTATGAATMSEVIRAAIDKERERLGLK